MRLDDAIEEYLLAIEGERAISTYKSRVYGLKKMEFFFGADKELQSITRRDAWEFRKYLRNHPSPRGGNLKPNTINSILFSASILFDFCIKEHEGISSNSFKGVSVKVLPPRPKFIPFEDVKKILNEAMSVNERSFAFILLLADSGARIGELQDLKWEDVDLVKGEAVILGKGDKLRKIYFSELASEALKAWKESERCSCKEQGDYVFSGFIKINCKKPLSYFTLRKMIERLAKKLGIKRWNPHSFRHGLVRMMSENGANLSIISRIVGHSTITTTQKYYALWEQDELGEQKRRFTSSFLDDE